MDKHVIRLQSGEIPQPHLENITSEQTLNQIPSTNSNCINYNEVLLEANKAIATLIPTDNLGNDTVKALLDYKNLTNKLSNALQKSIDETNNFRHELISVKADQAKKDEETDAKFRILEEKINLLQTNLNSNINANNSNNSNPMNSESTLKPTLNDEENMDTTTFALPDSDEEERIVDIETLAWKTKVKRNKGASNQSRKDKRKREDSASPNSKPITNNNSTPGKKVKIITQHDSEPNKKKQSTLIPGSTPKDAQAALKENPPPPIKICNVEDVNNLRTLIQNVIKDDSQFSLKAITTVGTKAVWKVNVMKEEHYRVLTKELNNNKEIYWYTHENKNTRDFRVMCKGMSPQTSEEDILDSLKGKNFNVISVVNIFKKIQPENGKGGPVKKEPLFLHQITFAQGEDPERVFNLKTICNQVVKIEACKSKPKLIMQCYRCQGFSHSKSYCHKPWACVKCAGNHPSSQCTIPGYNSNPKCANCNAGHVASFRDCPARKAALEERFQKKTEITSQENAKPINKPTGANNANNSYKSPKNCNLKSYASVASTPQNDLTQVMDLLNQIFSRMTTLETKLNAHDIALGGSSTSHTR
ncbi:unnamed protein product [Bemisia tabaci]|uniref:Pre-C2HC domain-containing protein n=1 Tax=Bemisia tabaci TaxID=7038 RepID=A0A9P0A5T4_BEMTA|nr:unnamed protein product [Bemisia tabaci]